MGKNAPAMLKRLSGLGMLRRAHRLLAVDPGRLRRIAAVEQADGDVGSVHRESSGAFARWIAWLIDLSPAGVRSVGRRLAFSGRELTRWSRPPGSIKAPQRGCSGDQASWR